MISAISSILGSVTVQRAQDISVPSGSPREREETQKKVSTPSVEVSAAQSQGFSARVGELVVNKASQSAESGSAVSGPTGADGMPPVAMPIGGPPPGPPADGAQGEGQNRDGGPASAASILSLLSGDGGMVEAQGEVQGETEGDGDADDMDAGSTLARPGQGANTQYALQQAGDGVFGVQFDDIGAYQFAASSY